MDDILHVLDWHFLHVLIHSEEQQPFSFWIFILKRFPRSELPPPECGQPRSALIILPRYLISWDAVSRYLARPAGVLLLPLGLNGTEQLIACSEFRVSGPMGDDRISVTCCVGTLAGSATWRFGMGSWSLFCLLCRVVCMFVVVGIVVVMVQCLSPQISEFDARPG
jgi:hypothetical protein